MVEKSKTSDVTCAPAEEENASKVESELSSEEKKSEISSSESEGSHLICIKY